MTAGDPERLDEAVKRRRERQARGRREGEWSIGLLVLGLAVGCALAWKRMHQI
jgi:hypothetical protein